jgi:far upstream element-binding protein
MTIETAHVGMVIGKGGDTLRRVERDTGARVQFAPGKIIPLSKKDDKSESQSRPGIRIANIFGSASQVNAARAAIRGLVETSMTAKGEHPRREPYERGTASRGREPNTGPGMNKFTFTVPDKCVGLIIGRGGESINEIQRKSGSRVNIVPESQSVNGRRPVNLFGSDEANERAKELIEAIVRLDEQGVKKAQPTGSDGKQRSSTVESYLMVPG